MSMPMNLPTVKMTADVAVTGVASNGDVSFSTIFSGATAEASADANPMIASALEGLQNAVKGIKGTATISSRGVVKAAKVDMGNAGQAQQMTNDLTSQIENLATPLPEEAVGAGAKWEIRQALKTAGQVQFQKITMEVTALDATSVTIKSIVEVTVPAQAMTNAALPAGTEVQLDASKGTGTGTSTIRLDSLIPTAEQTINSTMSMTMNMGGQSQPMSMENTIKITIAPAK